jgi:hypothetical protein
MAIKLPGVIWRVSGGHLQGGIGVEEMQDPPRMILVGLAESMWARSPGSARTAAGSRRSAATAAALSWCLCVLPPHLPDTRHLQDRRGTSLRRTDSCAIELRIKG